jgi:hypothetical protein
MHTARGFDRETGCVTLAGSAALPVDPSRSGRCTLHVMLLGKPGGSSGYARPILLMSWRCIPERLPGTPRRPPSPPRRLACNASWRFEWSRQRTESRVPGPEAILYYVHRDPALKHAGGRLPR